MRYLLLVCMLFLLALPAAAQEDGQTITLANGQITFVLPTDWVGQGEGPIAILAQDQNSFDRLGENIGDVYASISGTEPPPPAGEIDFNAPFAGAMFYFLTRAEAEAQGLLPDQMIASNPAAVAFEVNGNPAVRATESVGDANDPIISSTISVDYGSIVLNAATFVQGADPTELMPVFENILNSVQITLTSNVPAVLDVEPTPISLIPVSAQPASEIGSPETMSLSPDGNQAAWFTAEALCQYNFTDAAEQCFDLPEGFIAPPNSLKWSPDGQYIAFYESVLLDAVDSDIWIFDVANQTFTNRTDDGVTGNIIGAEAWLDYSPIWAGETLYFFRNVIGGETMPTFLFRFPSGLEGEPEAVMHFGDASLEPFIGYELAQENLNGAVDISPDGTWLALLYRPQDTTAAQVWLVNLSNLTIQNIPLTTFSGLGLPEWAKATPIILNGIAWLPDQSGFLVSSTNVERQPIPYTVFYYNLTTFQATAMVDFSAVADASAFTTPDASGTAPLYWVPRASVFLPESSATFTLHGDETSIGVAAISAGIAPVPMAAQAGLTFSYSPVSIGRDGTLLRMLMAGNIFTFEVE